MKSIYRQVREIRMAQKMTQEELAQKSGLMQTAISRFEKGERGATMDTLTKIAAALGKTLDFTDLAVPHLISVKPKQWVITQVPTGH
jgi:transcriptional regulator with XRE-family HTH domain